MSPLYDRKQQKKTQIHVTNSDQTGDLGHWDSTKAGLGIPVKLLHEGIGHTVTCLALSVSYVGCFMKKVGIQKWKTSSVIVERKMSDNEY